MEEITRKYIRQLKSLPKESKGERKAVIAEFSDELAGIMIEDLMDEPVSVGDMRLRELVVELLANPSAS